MYISDKCSFTPYKSNATLDKKIDSFTDLDNKYEQVKDFLEDNNNYGLDEIFRRSQIEKTNYELRQYIANQGYGLDKLINDESYFVRWAVANQGYGLDKLINDEEGFVRWAVAQRRYGLDKLANDEDEIVCLEVAKHGYGLDKLINNEHKYVRAEVRDYLEKHNLTLEQWIEQNPDKCALKKNKNNSIKKVTKDFIYKIDESNKLKVQSQYDSIDEFFSLDVDNDVKMNTLVVYAVDTKLPIIKIEKVKVDEKTKYKFIIDITNEDDDNFRVKSTIQTKEQLNKLIQQTVDALNNYPQFIKYIDDLENCL